MLTPQIPLFNQENNRIILQRKLLEQSLLQDIPLNELIRQNQMSYDDLIYIHHDKKPFEKRKNLVLSDFQKKENHIPIISFFSGAGGLDLGFEAAGFQHSMLIEKIPLFCETLRLNRPNWSVFNADVSETEEMVELIRNNIGSLSFDGVFIGGPPCQPFSIASNQRFSKTDKNFKRVGFEHKQNGNLLFNYVELIKIFRPKVFLIENVSGLMDIDNGKQLASVYCDLQQQGYLIYKPQIINSEYFHVPQQRIRLFIIGYLGNKKFSPLQPTNTPLACGNTFETPIINQHNHITREHSAESILRYMELAYGQRDKKGRVDRLDPSKPSKTIIAGGTKGGGRSHLHPYIPRTLSVRESARLQTFPDDYIFTGAVARQFTQVGNAVPPILAAQLATAIKHSYFE